MPRQANREGDFSFEIIRHLGVYGHSAKGWTREANIVEWNSSNAKFDLREWDPEHTRMSRGITLQKQEMFNLMQILNHCFGKELQAHRNAREQWMPQDGTRSLWLAAAGVRTAHRFAMRTVYLRTMRTLQMTRMLRTVSAALTILVLQTMLHRMQRKLPRRYFPQRH